MTHVHAWSRWIKGRRTQQWLRHRGYCGASERSETPPEDQVRPRGMPDAESAKHETINRRWGWGKFKAPVDVRAKRAGE